MIVIVAFLDIYVLLPFFSSVSSSSTSRSSSLSTVGRTFFNTVPRFSEVQWCSEV
jgi:hypothetical protein